MRAFVLLLCLLSAQAWGATKYVDLTGVGGATSGGSNPTTDACAGLGDASCAVSAGDTLYMCNEATIASYTLATAGTSNNYITYSGACPGGNPGVIHSSGGASNAGILQNKDWTIVEYLTIDNAGGRGIQTNCSNCKIRENRITRSQDNIFITTPQVKSNIYIGYNEIDNATRYGLTANYNGITNNQITDVTIEWNNVHDNANTGTYFKCDILSSSCAFKRFLVQFNTWQRNGNNAFVLQDCYVIGAVDCGDIQVNTGADFEDVIVCDNTATYNTIGGFAIYGLASSTGTWGKNKLCRNVSSYNNGVIGGFDWFNSAYLEVFDNEANWNTTTTIDGNAFLNDYGNNNVRIFRNKCFNNVGKAGTKNSGTCLMILKGQNVTAWGMIGAGNKQALFFSGGSFAESGIDINHFTVTGNLEYAAYFDATQDASSVNIRNSIFTGTGTAVLVETSGGINTEDYNVFYGFTTRSNYNGVGWSNGANSQVVNPNLVGGATPVGEEDFCLPVGSTLLNDGTYLGAHVLGFGDRNLGNPPAIGAMNDCHIRRATPTRRAASR